MAKLQYIPSRSLEGTVPPTVPSVSIVPQTPIELIPFAALLADHRTFTADATIRYSTMTCETGGGTTSLDGKESHDGPFEDDEKK